MQFLDYLPRTEARKRIAKLHNLFDGIVENKFKSMKAGELDKKIDDNTADLLDCMIHASSDPENQTLTREELRVRIIICKSARIFFFNLKFH
jgi:cytochrome P450